MAIKITYGVNNSVDSTAEAHRTVGHVLSDPNLRQFLGYGDNVEARIGGVTADTSQSLIDGDRIELVTKANKKG